jgi:type II secretory pathway pseudopilin PulG
MINRRNQGYSLIEVLIALLLTMIVMASVLGLLQKSQASFEREPEVSAMTQSARGGIDRISRDLTMAGFSTPPVAAVLWNDGEGIIPDEVTIVYAGRGVPISTPTSCGTTASNFSHPIPTREPGFHEWLNLLMPTAHAESTESVQKRKNRKKGQSKKSLKSKRKSKKKSKKGKSTKGSPGGGPGDGPVEAGGCALESGSFVTIDATQMDPVPMDPSTAYSDGMRMFAIETSDCNNDGQLGLVPIELTGDPAYDGSTLSLSYTAVSDEDLGVVAGTNRVVDQNCAVIGQFAVVQYRVSPLPPARNPMLERRDYGRSEPWRPISANVENLQFQYSVGTTNNAFNDVPTVPDPDDPESWITQVRVTVTGRSESTNLEGATPGVFDDNDTHLRRTFTTTVSLRNQLGTAQETALDQGLDGYN